MVKTLWKTVQRFLKNANVELPRDPAVSLPGRHPKEGKAGPQYTPPFTAAERWGRPRRPSADAWGHRVLCGACDKQGFALNWSDDPMPHGRTSITRLSAVS